MLGFLKLIPSPAIFARIAGLISGFLLCVWSSHLRNTGQCKSPNVFRSNSRHSSHISKPSTNNECSGDLQSIVDSWVNIVG